ncbi:MAG: DUF488 domain-containing protein [Rhodomicrobium sp.]
MATFYTIGHSNRPLEEFLRLLEQVQIELLADVRTIPKSRHNPQFNADALATALGRRGIAYRHFPKLGGLRSKQKGVTQSLNDYWENPSFRNYADYTATDAFKEGLGQLRALGGSHVCAIMCAEAVWSRCHRRIITDYLLAAREEVIHIMGEGNLEKAKMTETATIGATGVIIYPPIQGSLLS